MRQINAISAYLLGKWLDSCFLSARLPLDRNIGAWQNARALLDGLLNVNSPLHLNESWPVAVELRKKLDGVLAIFAAKPDAILTDEQVAEFNSTYAAFESVLALDFARAPIFFVSQKGIYATPMLINAADLALTPIAYGAISDDAKRDLNQSGRCLAFGISTACGFHAMRAVERVMREYYALVVGVEPGELPMGGLLHGMKGKPLADEKTLAALDQLRDLHRNPIGHPDVFLDDSEAAELFDIAKSAISAMARQIVKLKATP